MRLSSSLTNLSEAGSTEDSNRLAVHDDTEEGENCISVQEMAKSSVEMRQAALTMARLKLCWPAGYPRSVLILRKHLPEDNSLPEEVTIINQKVEFIIQLLTLLLPQTKVCLYENGMDCSDTDCVITLGGDGTVLQAAWLFQQIVPPILSIHLGTLGFLTVFEYDEKTLGEMLRPILRASRNNAGRPRIILRQRLACQINGSTWQVLNEIAIERGARAMMASLEVFVDGQLLTTALADGLLIATPTGSTAYSLSAGGPVVHPDVPCILLTPVAPHSLSFRPLVLPATASIEVRVAGKEGCSRSTVRISLDGKMQVELERGAVVQITASPFPVPTICRGRSQSEDWFAGLANCFRWAGRQMANDNNYNNKNNNNNTT